MKIENVNQHPAKANGFANLNRHGGTAGGTAHFDRHGGSVSGIAVTNRHGKGTYEGQSCGPHMDRHRPERYVGNETGGKTGAPSRHSSDSVRDADTWNRHNYDYRRDHSHLEGKKVILRKPEQLQKLDIRQPDKLKSIFFHPVPSRIRISIKDFDKNKLLPHPSLSPHNLYRNNSGVSIIRLNVYNMPGFKLNGINRSSVQASSGEKIKSADIYGLSEKEIASVLRLTELTMKIKQECYGNKLNYDKEYEKALKSWVGHFGGVYVPHENGKPEHRSDRRHARIEHTANKAQKSNQYFAYLKPDAPKHTGKYYIVDNRFGGWSNNRNNLHKDLFNRLKH